MLTQQSVINQLQNMADEIIQSGIHLKRMVLYGSYSRNEQQEWSDIDVAVVADEFTGFCFDDVRLFVSSLIKRPKLDIQTRTYNTKDFTPDKDPFVEEILRTGIEIVA